MYFVNWTIGNVKVCHEALNPHFFCPLTNIFFATEEVKYSKYVPRAKRWDKGCVKGHILVENWCDHRAKHQQQVQLDFHLTASCSICVCEMLHSSIHPRRIRNDTTSPQTKKEVSMEFPFLKSCIDILPSTATTYISEKRLVRLCPDLRLLIVPRGRKHKKDLFSSLLGWENFYGCLVFTSPQ